MVKGPSVVEVPFLWLVLLLQSVLLFLRVPTPPQYLVTLFPQSNGSSDYLLCDLQVYCLPENFVVSSFVPERYSLLYASVPYAYVAFLALPPSVLHSQSFRGSSWEIVLGPPLPCVPAHHGRSLVFR
jgi:hypothetical protein